MLIQYLGNGRLHLTINQELSHGLPSGDFISLSCDSCGSLRAKDTQQREAFEMQILRERDRETGWVGSWLCHQLYRSPNPHSRAPAHRRAPGTCPCLKLFLWPSHVSIWNFPSLSFHPSVYNYFSCRFQLNRAFLTEGFSNWKIKMLKGYSLISFFCLFYWGIVDK